MELYLISLLGLAAVGIIAYIAFKKEREPTTAPFTPNIANDKEILVEGWTEVEMRQIITKFHELYENKLGREFEVKVTGSRQKMTVHVRFPTDIPADEFGFLVNYIHYPEGFDLKGRSILAVAMATLTPDFAIPDKNLLGRRAKMYVPANDRDYDVVYVRVCDQTFENSFASRRWKLVADPRLPAGLPI